MHAQSVHLAGLADFLLRHVQTRTELHEHWAKYLSERDSGLKRAFTDLKTDNSAHADAMRAAMLTEFSASLGSTADAQKFLEGLLDGDNPLFSSRKTQKSALSSEQDTTTAAQIQLATIANRAAVEASTFEAYHRVELMAMGPEDEDDTEIISNEAVALGALYDTTIQELFNMLTSNAERQSFVDLCVARQAQILQRLPTSAMLVGGYLGLLYQNTPSTNLLDQFQKVLGLVEWIQRLSVVHGYLCLVRAEAATIDPGRWYSYEKRRAISRQLPSQVPSGQPNDIAAILSSSVGNGTFVQLEGQVVGLAIEDDPSPPKFSTFFELAELPSGARIRIRAHMFSLINNGLSDGAYVRLNGFVRLNPSWASTVGIDIDRVSLTELRRTSWYDDLTHRVRSKVQLYQDEMNIFFTPAVGGG